MKRFLILSFIFLFSFNASHAVLKEKDLAQTLGVLKIELEQTYNQQKKNFALYEQANKVQHAKLIDFMKHSDQIALMLYSQKNGFTFDLTYACQEATDQYKKLKDNNLPYDLIKSTINQEIARYDGLIKSLMELPPHIDENGKEIAPPPIASADSIQFKQVKNTFLLTDKEKEDRTTCITYAKALRNNLIHLQNSILKDATHYERVSTKLKSLNDYAMTRYAYLQQSIFINGESNYFKTLSNLPIKLYSAENDVVSKYVTKNDSVSKKSEWRGIYLIGIGFFTIFYIIVATIFSNVILRWLLPKKISQLKSFKEKRPLIILALGVVIFAISIMIAKLFYNQNFLIMACSLMINFAWLLAAILVSLLIRLRGNQLKAGMKMYTPFLLIAFIVISFRIILIPNNLVNLIFPPILLGFTIWQLIIIKKRKVKIPEADVVYSVISLIIMTIATIVSWSGYVLFAVQIMIWWIFQLAAIQSITCVYDLLNLYESGKLLHVILKKQGKAALKKGLFHWIAAMRKGDFITKTWLFDMIKMVVIPILAVQSILSSIYWSAEIFDMTAMCRNIFFYDFINEPGIIRLSLFKISLVAESWFVFNYINYAIHSFYRHYKKRKLQNKSYNITLARNVITISVWGIYIIFALALLQVPKSGISLVTAGLATGLGFAMKDLLENFFYGISLMTGRVRVGDYIECDGVLGKVESITYQSTQITTWDGSIIAFLNASLFNKNFKNLTRNHSYELVKVPIGVAYGTNIDKVREILTNAIKPLMIKNNEGKNIVSTKQGLKIIINDFGDNSVNLLVVFWVLVEERIGFISKVNEVIYNTLNSNHIEIPFPQRDIYVHQIPAIQPVDETKQNASK